MRMSSKRKRAIATLAAQYGNWDSTNPCDRCGEISKTGVYPKWDKHMLELLDPAAVAEKGYWGAAADALKSQYWSSVYAKACHPDSAGLGPPPRLDGASEKELASLEGYQDMLACRAQSGSEQTPARSQRRARNYSAIASGPGPRNLLGSTDSAAKADLPTWAIPVAIAIALRLVLR